MKTNYKKVIAPIREYDEELERIAFDVILEQAMKCGTAVFGLRSWIGEDGNIKPEHLPHDYTSDMKIFVIYDTKIQYKEVGNGFEK